MASGRTRYRAPVIWLALTLLWLPVHAAPRGGDKDDSAALIEIVPPGEPHGGRFRVHALVTSSRIERVEFLLDGRLVSADDNFPFSGRLEVEQLASASTMEVVALDREGTELARDRLALGGLRTRPSIAIAEVLEVGSRGWIEVAAKIDHPLDLPVERVDFYRGEHLAASTRRSPYRARIPRDEHSGYLRAIAHMSDGQIAEGVRILDVEGVADTTAVNLVEIYAMVSDRRGRPRTDLERTDFRLYDGRRQLVPEQFAVGDDVPLSVGLVIDSSGSMALTMGEAKRAARLFLEQALDEADEALLVDFDDRPRLLQPRTSDVEQLVSRFDAVSSHGDSAVYDAILFSLLQLEGAPGRKALVVLSDGLDSASRVTVEDCIRTARRTGVPVFVVSMGDRLEHRPSHRTFALRRLAEQSGGVVYNVTREEHVVSAYSEIDLQLRGQYLLGFSTDSALSVSELDALQLSVTADSLRVRALLGGQIQVMD